MELFHVSRAILCAIQGYRYNHVKAGHRERERDRCSIEVGLVGRLQHVTSASIWESWFFQPLDILHNVIADDQG